MGLISLIIFWKEDLGTWVSKYRGGFLLQCAELRTHWFWVQDTKIPRTNFTEKGQVLGWFITTERKVRKKE